MNFEIYESAMDSIFNAFSCLTMSDKQRVLQNSLFYIHNGKAAVEHSGNVPNNFIFPMYSASLSPAFSISWPYIAEWPNLSIKERKRIYCGDLEDNLNDVLKKISS